MIRTDRQPDAAPGACYFLGGFVGSLFGGGSSTDVSQTSTQATNVTVEVNPQIGVAVDTGPVAEAVSEAVREVGAAGRATADTLAASITAQNATVAKGLVALGENAKQIVGVALAAFVAWRIIA